MSERKIGVVGAGLMGHGIAYLLAAAGHDVCVFEPVAASRASLPQRLHAIAALFGDDSAHLRRISAHDQLAPAVKDAAFVFEAAPERLSLKNFCRSRKRGRAGYHPCQQQFSHYFFRYRT